MKSTSGVVSVISLATLLVTGCGGNEPTDEKGMMRDRKYDYRFIEETSRIKVPENLSSEALVDLYPVPELSPYAGTDFVYDLPMAPQAVGANRAAVSIQRLGAKEWVLTAFSPSQVWPRLKEFIAQQGLSVLSQNGAKGIIRAYQGAHVFEFDLDQGFQRNTSELQVTAVPGPDGLSEITFTKAQEYTRAAAQYFADLADKPTYSYAAQGISTDKKLEILQDRTGQKQLMLSIDQKRGLAALRDALASAGYKIDMMNAQSPALTLLDVTYYPVKPEDEKPGFWGKLFGEPADGFDKNAPYAGNQYLITMRSIKGKQIVNAELPAPKEGEDTERSPFEMRKEINYVILLLQKHMS
ncbi:Outer membrane protein assembly factor BamC [BD1-7 clade bacterium]|uniref:Outer membrane protein assembly factor BamC n=1 Tax=BD1-7 clade bacterium TaxID=2029982 RepID=A0A5S9R073_9GAMM|nr:Outer membrane protein assembly factor BamC [BD1-7 clade bacterium]